MTGYMEKLKEFEEKKEPSPQWERPINFDSKALPAFNTDVFAPWVKKYIDGVAETTQTPVDASAIATISVLSTILSKKSYVKVSREWKEPLNTYAIMGLPPGNRKSGVFKLLTDPITLFEKEERERLLPQVKQQQAILKAKKSRLESLNSQYGKKGDESILKDIEVLAREIEAEEIVTIPRLITNDVTVEKLGLLMAEHNEKMSVLSAEGAGALNSMAGRYDKGSVDASMNLYLEAHPGDTVTIDRMGRESIHLDEPSLTIGLFIQPETVRSLPASFNERGLMQRFLYAFPESMVGYRLSTPKSIDESVRAAYLSNMKRLLEYQPDTALMLNLSREAVAAEIQNREEIEVMLQDDGELGGIREWGSKLAGQIIRITGLLHFADNIQHFPNIPSEVSKETFEAAKSLRSYFIAHAKEAYGVMESTDDEKEQKYIFKKLSERFKGEAVVQHQELWQLLKKKYKKVAVMDNAISQLEGRNFIRIAYEGRRKVIQINPSFHKATKTPPNTPNDGQTQAGQGVELRGSKTLVDPKAPTSTPIRGKLGELGEARGESIPNETPTESRDERRLGELGVKSEEVIKINEDGSGLL